MTLKQYQSLCVSSLPKHLYRGDEALMAILSMNGAAGECSELYKRTLYEGAELSQEAFLDNLSDAIFAITIAAHAFDVDLESIFKRSVDRVNKTLEKDSDTGDKEMN